MIVVYITAGVVGVALMATGLWLIVGRRRRRIQVADRCYWVTQTRREDFEREIVKPTPVDYDPTKPLPNGRKP